MKKLEKKKEEEEGTYVRRMESVFRKKKIMLPFISDRPLVVVKWVT